MSFLCCLHFRLHLIQYTYIPNMKYKIGRMHENVHLIHRLFIISTLSPFPSPTPLSFSQAITCKNVSHFIMMIVFVIIMRLCSLFFWSSASCVMYKLVYHTIAQHSISKHLIVMYMYAALLWILVKIKIILLFFFIAIVFWVRLEMSGPGQRIMDGADLGGLLYCIIYQMSYPSP